MIRFAVLSILISVNAFATNVVDHGAIPNDGRDDAPAFQAAIDVAIGPGGDSIVDIPGGTWDLFSSVIVHKPLPNGLSYPVSITISGPNVYPYAAQTGRTAFIRVHHKDGFGLGLQLVKGATVENLYFQGENTIAFATPKALAEADEATGFVKEGIRDNQWSPYAGIVVDPLGIESVECSDRYPEFQDQYTQGSGGSTNVNIDNVRVMGFVVGILASPGGTANGDHIITRNCRVEQVKTAIAYGQSQNRSCTNYELMCWGPALYLTNGSEYGPGSGPVPNMVGGNVAGMVKYLMWAGGGTTSTACWTHFFAESFYSIGRTSNLISFNGCQFKLDWRFPSAATHLSCLVADFNGCNIWYSANPPNTRGLQISSTAVSFRSCRFDVAPFMCGQNGSYRFGATYENCEQRHLGNRHMIDTASGSVVAITNHENVTGTVTDETLTFESSDASKWSVGDQLILSQDVQIDEFGERHRQYVGYISAITDATVMVSKVPFNVPSGQYWLARYETTARQ